MPHLPKPRLTIRGSADKVGGGVRILAPNTRSAAPWPAWRDMRETISEQKGYMNRSFVIRQDYGDTELPAFMPLRLASVTHPSVSHSLPPSPPSTQSPLQGCQYDCPTPQPIHPAPTHHRA